MKYTVTEAKYQILLKKVEELSKKAKKINVDAPKMTVISEFLFDKDNVTTYKMVEFELYAPIVKYDGWSFIGVIQHEESVNILRLIGNIEIPEKYKTDSPTCEHCNTNRYRKDTYVVKHDNGEYKRVGRSCLKDFTGHQNIEVLAKYFNMLLELEEFIERDSGGNGEKEVYYIRPIRYMAYVIDSYKEYGWRSANLELPTYYGAFANYLANQAVNEQYYNSAEEVINWAKNISPENRNNNYFHNIWAISQKEALENRDLAIFASIYHTYNKEHNTNNYSNSNFIGQIGDKKVCNLKFVNRKSIFSMSFGNSFVYQFDNNGDIVIWISKKDIDLTENTTYNIECKIKEHKVYNGIKQTYVKNCKILGE